jgi:hypothetical protein
MGAKKATGIYLIYVNNLPKTITGTVRENKERKRGVRENGSLQSKKITPMVRVP